MAEQGTDGREAGRAHPIQGLMQTAMQSLQAMVDVNTVVGDAVETKDGSVIVPVSQVAFGFCSGGGEYGTARPAGTSAALPFGGGSGAGVSVRPVAFLVVSQGNVRLLPVDQRASFERLLDLAPEIADKVLAMLGPRDGAARAVAGRAASDGRVPGVDAPVPAESPV
jgi:sporulation protein YtfJ